MRVYLAVVDHTGARDLDSVVREAAARSLPFRSSGEPLVSWDDRTDGSQVLLAAWSNEPSSDEWPFLTIDARGARGHSGYVRGPVPVRAELPEGSAGLGGVWSLFAADRDGVAAATCASGAEVVYVAETAGRVVVGNRALLVHLVAHGQGPVPDLVGLAGVLNAGYAVTDRTAFAGVRALAPRQLLTCDREGRTRTSPLAGPGEPASAHDVARALVASVGPLVAVEQPVRLGLTGGRDSRLLVALLSAAGVPVRAYTSGLAGDPDVLVAREVAAALGVPHQVTAPKGARVEEGSVTVDVRGRLREAVVLGEGTLSAYDRVGRIDERYNARTLPFAGSGGEILRAYYAAAVKEPDDPDAVMRYMRGRLFSGLKRLTPDLRAAYEDDTRAWMDAATRDGVASLEDFYVRQRTGRWMGAARSSASLGSLAQRPYVDHLVVDAVRRVPLADRMSERLVAEILDELAPTLADVRFAGRRWSFDEVAPTDPAARAAWEQRAPVVGAHGDQAGLNWRTDLPEVRRELADVVMAAPDDFWTLVDRRKVGDFVAKADDRTRADTMRMWHLATVADALTHRFHMGGAKFDAEAREVMAARPADAPASEQRSPLEQRARRLARRVRDRLRS